MLHVQPSQYSIEGANCVDSDWEQSKAEPASDQCSTGGCTVGRIGMSDRHWHPFGQEHDRPRHPPPQQPQQSQEHHHPVQPLTQPFPIVQPQQLQAPYHAVDVSAPTHTTCQPASVYPGVDPTLAANYYQYGAAYGSVGAFPFPPPPQQQQVSFVPMPCTSFFGETSAGRAGQERVSFRRPKLTQIGRALSSPETPTRPPPMASSVMTISAPPSASFFPPPNGRGSQMPSAERRASSETTYSFVESYQPGYAEFLLHHHHQQQQQSSVSSVSSPSQHSPPATQLLPSFGHVTTSDQSFVFSTPELLRDNFREASFAFPQQPQSPSALVMGAGGEQGAGTQQMTCAVCQDVAACLHYGVRTCEGCKGFFKRTVQKNSKYVCLGNRDCVIDKRRRNRCQYCRFQKCLAVGMVKEVVRTDTMKGRRGRLPSKSKITEEAGPSGLGGYVVGAQSLAKALLSAYTANGSPSTSARLGSADRFVDSLRVSFQQVRLYAERIPGWTNITPEDRTRLLKRFGIQTLAMRWAYRSMTVAANGKILADDGLVYSMECCPSTWRTWYQSVLALSTHFRDSLELDLTSFSCLCALTIVFNECTGLQRVEEVDKLKNNVINCLKEHCTYSADTRNKPQYFARILAILNESGSLGQYARQAYRNSYGDTTDTATTSGAQPGSTFFDEALME